jgi:protein involved in polysaccharide export with SLBB domain
MERRKPWLQFSLRSILVLMLGIAIGYALNLQSIRMLLGPANEFRMNPLPVYVIEPPDVISIGSRKGDFEALQPVLGEHLVGPDGRINLGAYGSVYITGHTIEEATSAIQRQLAKQLGEVEISVDVFAYNSKKYYVVTKGSAIGDNVIALPITGNETVLDALAAIKTKTTNAKMWIARPAPNGLGNEQVLPIDWDKIANGTSTATNYQLLPGDRLFVSQNAK